MAGLSITYLLEGIVFNHFYNNVELVKGIEASELAQEMKYITKNFRYKVNSLYLDRHEEFDVEPVDTAIRQAIARYMKEKNLTNYSKGDVKRLKDDVADYYLYEIANITDNLHLKQGLGMDVDYDSDDEPWDELS